MKKIIIKNVAHFLANIWAAIETLSFQINRKYRNEKKEERINESSAAQAVVSETQQNEIKSPTAFKTKTILTTPSKKLEDLPNYNLHTLYKATGKKKISKRSNV